MAKPRNTTRFYPIFKFFTKTNTLEESRNLCKEIDINNIEIESWNAFKVTSFNNYIINNSTRTSFDISCIIQVKSTKALNKMQLSNKSIWILWKSTKCPNNTNKKKDVERCSKKDFKKMWERCKKLQKWNVQQDAITKYWKKCNAKLEWCYKWKGHKGNGLRCTMMKRIGSLGVVVIMVFISGATVVDVNKWLV
jgi:hypothetical protein